MPYAFDYAVASSYGASFAAREEESGRGTVGQFQLVCTLFEAPKIVLTR